MENSINIYLYGTPHSFQSIFFTHLPKVFLSIIIDIFNLCFLLRFVPIPHTATYSVQCTYTHRQLIHSTYNMGECLPTILVLKYMSSLLSAHRSLDKYINVFMKIPPKRNIHFEIEANCVRIRTLVFIEEEIEEEDEKHLKKVRKLGLFRFVWLNKEWLCYFIYVNMCAVHLSSSATSNCAETTRERKKAFFFSCEARFSL